MRAHSLHKNLARLYEAFGNLKRSGHLAKDLKLVVSGKPNDDEGHQLLKCGIWEDFVFAGFIPDEQLPSYYRGAQALALISLYEGFGLPVLEAMACGTPVTASNVTPLPEVARDAALLVNPYEVESIEVGLERVLNYEDLRNSLRVKGLEWALEFDWDRTAARAQVILSDALRYSESRISKKENTV